MYDLGALGTAFHWMALLTGMAIWIMVVVGLAAVMILLIVQTVYATVHVSWQCYIVWRDPSLSSRENTFFDAWRYRFTYNWTESQPRFWFMLFLVFGSAGTASGLPRLFHADLEQYYAGLLYLSFGLPMLLIAFLLRPETRS